MGAEGIKAIHDKHGQHNTIAGVNKASVVMFLGGLVHFSCLSFFGAGHHM